MDRDARRRAAAAAAGIPIVRTKLLAYGTGAAFGGISGAFFASYLGVVNAAQFEFSFSIFIFAMVVLGGLGSIAGVVAGAIVLSVVNNYLLPDVLFDLPASVGLDFDLSAISSGIYGAILVVMMLLRPQGLVPAGAYCGVLPVGTSARPPASPTTRRGSRAGQAGGTRDDSDASRRRRASPRRTRVDGAGDTAPPSALTRHAIDVPISPAAASGTDVGATESRAPRSRDCRGAARARGVVPRTPAARPSSSRRRAQRPSDARGLRD